jgi:hypothetical protein
MPLPPEHKTGALDFLLDPHDGISLFIGFADFCQILKIFKNFFWPPRRRTT